HPVGTGLKRRYQCAPAWSFHNRITTESRIHRGGVRHGRRRSFAFVRGCQRWREAAIAARLLLHRDSPRALTRAESALHLATSSSDNPSSGRLLSAPVTKW